MLDYDEIIDVQYPEYCQMDSIPDESPMKQALTTVYQDRQEDYGDPWDNVSLTAELWSVYLGVDVHPSDVPIMQILTKIAREKIQHKPDNMVDVAGYTDVYEHVRQQEKRQEIREMLNAIIDWNGVST